MEGQLWRLIVAVLATIDKRRKRAREAFSDQEIVEVFYWSVIHDRPVSWACQKRNWPLCLRARSLPSNTTMSRRLRSRSVVTLLDALERRVSAPCRPHLYWMIDGKPLVISQSGYTAAPLARARCARSGARPSVSSRSSGTPAASASAMRCSPSSSSPRSSRRRAASFRTRCTTGCWRLVMRLVVIWNLQSAI